MKLLATSDVHQMISKWKDLVNVCHKEKPDVVAIAGDLFPKDTYILDQITFMEHLKKYARQIGETGAEIVIILGNDDNQLLIPMMEEGEDEGLWHYLHEKICKIGGYEFVGMPYVPDYPFGYKYWCHSEYADNPRIDPQQFTSPVIVDEDNKFVVIEDYPAYLKSKKSINKALTDLAEQVEDLDKSVWLIHAPPSSMGLDVCCHGARVGSYAVLDFIGRYQPFVCIHGHIHESPIYSGNKWCESEGKTLCIQGGQIGMDLHYSILEIEGSKVINKKHSVYD